MDGSTAVRILLVEDDLRLAALVSEFVQDSSFAEPRGTRRRIGSWTKIRIW